jgi:F0F1-type ATP synthase assembly protein I
MLARECLHADERATEGWERAMEREFLREILEAALAMVLLGALVAVIYLLVMGSLPWTFFIGELLGLALGTPLLVIAGPRRRRP